MEWARDYYTKQSETFATGEMTDAHRAIAARLHGWFRGNGGAGDASGEIDRGRRVLELGAGMGGTAAALADLGYDVWAVEFNPSDVAHARELARIERAGTLMIVEADFREVKLDGEFDFVFYWDGFGVGSDDEQRRLLRRIGQEWLAPHGRALLDVYSPWNWQRRSGETSVFTARDGQRWERKIEYDARECRFIDHWTPLPDRNVHRAQTLRCYTLSEFTELLNGTGLIASSFIGMDGRALSPHGEPDAYLRQTNGFFVLVERDHTTLRA